LQNAWDYQSKKETKKIKTKAAALLIILLIICLLLAHQQGIKAQSGAHLVNYTLFFHDYSLLLSASNGSLCVYDGADGSSNSVNPTQTNLIADIPGQQSGFSYWSADIIWAIKLPMDLHVDGTVNIEAYISSNFELSGFFSGGGYGMGLVDIDQNNNVVQEFITQAPYTIGGNPFTSSPALYSVSTGVDYTFKAGHSIGFAVGVGATTQGFTATVYFDSLSCSSGATLPVVDASLYQSFTADSQSIGVASDSAISNFQYNSGLNSIQFNAEGINYTTGYCNVSIPKALMQQPFTVDSASQQITSTLTENSTCYQLYFTHTLNANAIQITGTATQPATQPTVQPTKQPTTRPTKTPTASASALPTAHPQNTPPTLPEFASLDVTITILAETLTAILLKKRLTRKLSKEG